MENMENTNKTNKNASGTIEVVIGKDKNIRAEIVPLGYAELGAMIDGDRVVRKVWRPVLSVLRYAPVLSSGRRAYKIRIDGLDAGLVILKYGNNKSLRVDMLEAFGDTEDKEAANGMLAAVLAAYPETKSITGNTMLAYKYFWDAYGAEYERGGTFDAMLDAKESNDAAWLRRHVSDLVRFSLEIDRAKMPS